MKPAIRPFSAWVVVTPEGGPCPFLMEATRRDLHCAFNNWSQDMTWKQASRKGWRCVKVNCAECAPAR